MVDGSSGVSAPEGTSSSEQSSLPEGEHSAEEIFSRVGGEVKSDHKYFVDNPPDKVEFDEEALRELESKEPFFVDVEVKQQDGRTNFSAKPNKDVVPYAFDENLGRRVERFAKAEDLTKGDSGLLALAAISAETPEQQARLYKAVSQVVLEVHRSNPDLLKEWLEAQVNSADPLNSSVQIFYFHQLQRGQETGSYDEILLPMNQVMDPRMAQTMWAPRIAELEEVIKSDKFQPHHLRWIEYLSHSVDMQKVFDKVKQTPNRAVTSQRGEPAEVLGEAAAESSASQPETKEVAIAEFGEVGETVSRINDLVIKLREKGFYSGQIPFKNGSGLLVDLATDKNGRKDPRFNRPITIKKEGELTEEEIGMAKEVLRDEWEGTFVDKDGFSVMVKSFDGNPRVAYPGRSKKITEPDIQAKFTIVYGNYVSNYVLGRFSSVRDPQEGLNLEEAMDYGDDEGFVSQLRERPRIGEKDPRLWALKYIQAGLEFEVNRQ